jgi:hypothetical protein
MNYTLSPLASLAPCDGPDLRAELLERRKIQRDVRLEARHGRFVLADGRLALHVEGRTLPLAEGARAFLSEQVGLGRMLVKGSHSEKLNDWADRQGEILARLEGDRVRAVLPGAVRRLDSLELLEEITDRLRKLPVAVRLEHCVEEDGDLHLTLVAPELAGEVNEGDYIYGGFYLAHSETTLAETEASVRIYRVACKNGALMDCSEGQRMTLPAIVAKSAVDPYAGWPEKLGRVLARSFDGGDVDVEAKRFRSTVSQILATPYEILLNLVAQGIVSEDEQSRIQREFNEGRDDSLFALVNAVTFQAHGMRDRNDWRRAAALERLGGEILRGDHQPPVLEPVYT